MVRLHSAPITRSSILRINKTRRTNESLFDRKKRNSFTKQTISTQTSLGINEFYAARLLNDLFHVDTSVRFIFSKGSFDSLFSAEVPFHSSGNDSIQDRTHSFSTSRRESTRSTSNERSWNFHFYLASTNKFSSVTIERWTSRLTIIYFQQPPQLLKPRFVIRHCVDARVYYSFPYRPCIKSRRKNRVQTFGISQETPLWS